MPETGPGARAAVGRDEEQERIARFLDAGTRLPAALVLEGAGGIGKTTLWRYGVDLAAGLGYRVLSCTAATVERRLSYAALSDLLGPVLDDAFEALPEPQRQALAVALLLEPAEGTPADPRAIAAACLGAVRAAAERGRLLVAIDDVQWLDGASASALAFAARRLADEPVAFLLARRPEVGERVTEALGERAEPLTLGPLSLGALHRILSSQLGLALPRPVLRRVVEASGGNPYFALEIGRALVRRGLPIDAAAPLPIPADLHELVRRRVRQLSPAGRTALLAAAVLSHPSEELVEALGGAAGLEEALAADVLVQEGMAIRFSHPLLAESVYAGAGGRQRREMHGRAAELVGDPEERGLHLARAATAPDADVAAELDGLAERARARGTPEVAAELIERALALTPGPLDGDRRRRRLAAAGAHFDAGNAGRAIALLREGVTAAPPGPGRAEKAAELARLVGDSGDLGEAVSLSYEALSEAEGDDVLEGRVHQRLARLLVLGQDAAAAAAHARTAVRLAASTGDLAFEARALAALGMIELRLGHGLQAELMERALALEERCEPLWLDDSPSAIFAAQLLCVGELDRARSLLERLHGRAAESGDASLWLTDFYLSAVETRAGDLAVAERRAEDAHELAALSGRRLDELPPLHVLAQLDVLRGRVDAARRRLADLLERCEQGEQPLWAAHGRAALGVLELSLGDPAAAYAELGPAVEALLRAGTREPGFLPFLPDAVEALVQLGRPEEAIALLAPFEERSRSLGRHWTLAQALRCRGLVAVGRGDLAGAFDAFEQALAEHDAARMPLDRARTLLALGAARRRAKQKRLAREALEEALRTFETVGTPLWAERARLELARTGGRTGARDQLTPSERRIAALVAAGESNRQVAAELFVTVHTVEAALTRIYRKLGVRSRTQLASRFATGAKV